MNTYFFDIPVTFPAGRQGQKSFDYLLLKSGPVLERSPLLCLKKILSKGKRLPCDISIVFECLFLHITSLKF